MLQTGGASTAVKDGNNPVFSAQIFDPKTDTWTKAASPTVPRVYHSSALLLPDGRVATFGGNPEGSFEMRIEIYSPAYLEKDTPRPRITSGPTEMTLRRQLRARHDAGLRADAPRCWSGPPR